MAPVSPEQLREGHLPPAETSISMECLPPKKSFLKITPHVFFVANFEDVFSMNCGNRIGLPPNPYEYTKEGKQIDAVGKLL